MKGEIKMNGIQNSTSKNNGGKKKGKFNIIDFLIILVILLLIAAIIYVFLPSSWIQKISSDKSVDIQYTIEIKGVDEAFLNNIREKDIVLNSVNKSNIGTVTAVDYSTQHTQLEYNQSEQIGVLSVVPDKYDVIVTISATAEFTEAQGYTVNGTRIAVGEKINARFPDYVCEGYCISVPIN